MFKISYENVCERQILGPTLVLEIYGFGITLKAGCQVWKLVYFWLFLYEEQQELVYIDSLEVQFARLSDKKYCRILDRHNFL